MEKPLKIAHRGYTHLCKENTLDAFQQAVIHNFDMIEMDIQLCKEKEIVIIHDNYLGNKMIKDLTLEEIKQIDSTILTLREFFIQFDYTSISLYLDMKGEDELAEVLCSFLLMNEINTSKIYFASFNLNHLDYLADFPFKLGFLCENKLDLPMISYIVNKYQVSFFAISWVNVDSQVIHFIHSLHKLVFAYTVHNDNILNFLQQLNLDGLITDILL